MPIGDLACTLWCDGLSLPPPLAVFPSPANESLYRDQGYDENTTTYAPRTARLQHVSRPFSAEPAAQPNPRTARPHARISRLLEGRGSMTVMPAARRASRFGREIRLYQSVRRGTCLIARGREGERMDYGKAAWVGYLGSVVPASSCCDLLVSLCCWEWKVPPTAGREGCCLCWLVPTTGKVNKKTTWIEMRRAVFPWETDYLLAWLRCCCVYKHFLLG